MAAGTFFYIAVMDLLAEEFAAKTSHWMRYLMTVLGFSIMALVAIWTCFFHLHAEHNNPRC
jgi:hypothetical protein